MYISFTVCLYYFLCSKSTHKFCILRTAFYAARCISFSQIDPCPLLDDLRCGFRGAVSGEIGLQFLREDLRHHVVLPGGEDSTPDEVAECVDLVVGEDDFVIIRMVYC